MENDDDVLDKFFFTEAENIHLSIGEKIYFRCLMQWQGKCHKVMKTRKEGRTRHLLQ
jgi:hypothetical protein